MLKTFQSSTQCLHELFHQAKHDTKLGKSDLLSADDWVIYNVWHACFQSFTDRPLFLGSVFLLSSAVPHALKAWKLREASLLTMEEVEHFQVHTNDPVGCLIFE